MHRRIRVRGALVAVAVTFGLSGCVTGGGGATAPRSTADRIVAEDLVDMQQLDAFSAIQRLRPTWLRSRSGSEPQVLVDGNRQMGGLGLLRSLPVSDIQRIEYMSGTDATTRYGTGFDGGVILLTTKR